MKLVIHTLIAFLALTFGYPEGGNSFILIMIPYLFFMVMKCNSVYLPALILHCASETSATTFVFISFIVLSITKYGELKRLGLSTLFWVLLSLSPVFFWLVWQRITNLSEYPPVSLAYIGSYLSFFAFFFGVLISKSFNKQILNTIYLIIFVAFLLYATRMLNFTRMIVSFSALYLTSLAVMFSKEKKNKVYLAISIFSLISFFFVSSEITLTNLLVSFFAFSIALLYFKDKKQGILKLTGFAPFLVIFILYAYGIINYLDMHIDYSPDKQVASQNFSARIFWKFFTDRAPYWAGGFAQIIHHKHLFPIVDLPDIIAIMPSGNEQVISFGSHTTFIELFRKFGLIPGLLLSYSFIKIVVSSRNIFQIRKIDPYLVAFFSMAISTNIVLSITGQYQLLPGYALLSIGPLGIAYYKFYTETRKVQ